MEAEDRMERIFMECYEGCELLGPGDKDTSRRALGAAAGLPARPDILDVGCGTGGSALLLTRETGGRVTALDMHPPFLDDLRRRAAQEGLSDRIVTIVGDMADMPFERESFDLIWGEGSIYSIGFERGVRLWKVLLRPGGYLAVSDMVRFQKELPEEVAQFWARENLTLITEEEQEAILRQKGYTDVSSFRVPSVAWENYYGPLAERLVSMRKKYTGDEEALGVVENLQEEIDFYERWGDTYGYAFFIAKRP